MSTSISLYDLNSDSLSEWQKQVFVNSLPKYSDSYESEQEKRQLALRERPISVSINVAREDFPHVNGDIVVSYLPNAPQASWKSFIQDVRRALSIEFVDSIYDKYDKSPLHCIKSLKHRGRYYVRQREESSVLEVMNTGQTPAQISWPITRIMNLSKDNLHTQISDLPPLNERVYHLVSQPIARPQQREATKAILSATAPNEIIHILEKIMTSEIYIETEEERESRIFEEMKRARANEILHKDYLIPSHQNDNNSNNNNNNISTENTDSLLSLYQASSVKRTHDKEVDIISLHRLSLESLQRIVIKKKLSLQQQQNERQQRQKQQQQQQMTQKSAQNHNISNPHFTTDKNVNLPLNILFKQHSNKTNSLDDTEDTDKSAEQDLQDFTEMIMNFSKTVIMKFMAEVDVVVMGLNLLNELFPLLSQQKRIMSQVLGTVLNVMGVYAPPPPPNRPRNPKRLLPSRQEEVRFKQEQDALRLADLMVREEMEAIRAQKTQTNSRNHFQQHQQNQQQQHHDDARDIFSRNRSHSSDYDEDNSGDEHRLTATPPSPSADAVRSGQGSIASLARTSRRGRGAQAEAVAVVEAGPIGKRVWKGGSTAARRVAKAAPTRYISAYEEDANANNLNSSALIIQPLPVTKGVQFRGMREVTLDAKVVRSNRSLGLAKAVAALYAYLISHPAHVEEAQKLCVDEEIAEIALVCQAHPRVLEYIVWIIDKISLIDYEDYDDDLDNEADRMNFYQKVGSGNDSQMKVDTKRVSKKSRRGRRDTSMVSADNNIATHEREGQDIALQREDKEFSKPWKEVLVLCMALASGHGLVNDRDRSTANLWLRRWDDGSRDFRLLCRKGLDMSGL